MTRPTRTGPTRNAKESLLFPPIRFRPLALLGLLAAIGCGDSANNNPMGPSGSAGISATIDGSAWTAVSAQAIRSSNIIGIGAADASQVGIGIGFVDAGTGTYVIDATSATNALVSEGAQTWTASAGNGGTGTITVTTLTSTRIAGTFSFTAPALTGTPTPATRVVTNGVFDLSF